MGDEERVPPQDSARKPPLTRVTSRASARRSANVLVDDVVDLLSKALISPSSPVIACGDESVKAPTYDSLMQAVSDTGSVRTETWRNLQGDRRRARGDVLTLHLIHTIKLIQGNVSEALLPLLPFRSPRRTMRRGSPGRLGVCPRFFYFHRDGGLYFTAP